MADTRTIDTNPGAERPKARSGSDMDPPVVKPLSEADPSVAPDWNEHVQEYFNEDAHSGEPIPTAAHEAKE